MTRATQLLTIADRTPKERRNMAEFYASTFEWKGDLLVTKFEDGSALMIVLDGDLAPVEMIEV